MQKIILKVFNIHIASKKMKENVFLQKEQKEKDSVFLIYTETLKILKTLDIIVNAKTICR